MQDHARALNVAQKFVSQTSAFGSALDQTRQIREYKTSIARQFRNAQLRRKRGEWIGANLGLSAR